MSDAELFREVFATFQARYGGLEMQGPMIYYNGRVAFNYEGYNLLYNLTRLCATIKNKLL